MELEFKKIINKHRTMLPYEWWLTFEDGTNGWADIDVEIGGYLAYDGDYEIYFPNLDSRAIITKIKENKND